ncbi:MAG: HAD family phosphatase [Prevotellaceae bacterium]|nr:HAD family phosphatase [Prevotella sp.]MDD7256984.1 HAD family phosphatase [Prevotellaceae bacterium]MDY6130367.1 HAD family phosphatase [Prevotella sp.]
MMEGIKNIVFDFGGVIVNLDRQRCIKALNSIGAQNIACYVDECRQEDLFHDLEIGHINRKEFCEAVRNKSAGCKATDEDICWAWGQLLTDIPAYKTVWLRKLKEHYRLFLLSNTNEIHWQLFGHHIEDCFEKSFLSYKMHLLKPDAEIFQRVLADASIKAEETLFVDDSKVNCDSAERLGFGSMWAKDGGEWEILVR